VSTVPTAPQPTKVRQSRPTPARAIRWRTTPLSAERPYGAVRIARGRAAHDYVLCELPAADGRGFALEKIDPTVPAADRAVYHVFLHHNGRDRACDCLGFTRWGRCKHADGLAALLTR
jgi:hypothetical protein